MDKMRKRKFNTLYLLLTTVAICMMIMANIEFSRIFGILIGVLGIIFVGFDERSQYAFPDGEEDDLESE